MKICPRLKIFFAKTHFRGFFLAGGSQDSAKKSPDLRIGIWFKCALHELIFFSCFCSAPGGDFQSILDEDMVPFEEDVQGFLRQILEALQFIHDKNIAHLDIKVSKHTVAIELVLDQSLTKLKASTPKLYLDIWDCREKIPHFNLTLQV